MLVWAKTRSPPTDEEIFLWLKHERKFHLQGDRVSNETKEGAVERFMKEVTRKNKVKRYQAYRDTIPKQSTNHCRP